MYIKIGNRNNTKFNVIGILTLHSTLVLFKKLIIDKVYFEHNALNNSILVNLSDNKIKEYLDSI